MSIKESKYKFINLAKLNKLQKQEWRELWNISELRHFFNSPDFFEVCLEAFNIRKYEVIFCYEKDKLCGVLPLFKDRFFGIKTLSSTWREGNYFDRSFLLVNKRDCQLLNAVIERALQRGNLALIEINEKTKESVDSCEFAHVSEWASRTRWTNLSSDSDVLRFMSKKQRKNLFRRIKRREKDLEFKFFRTDLQEAFEAVLEIEKGSYKSRRHMAFFEKKASKKLLSILLKRKADNMRIGILYYKKRPAAAVLGFVSQDTFLGYHTAFLEEFHNWGAGKIAIYFLLEYLSIDGYKKIDMLRGDSELKSQFGENTMDQYNVYFSKSFSVRFFWRICIPALGALKKVKAVYENKLNALYYRLSVKKVRRPQDFEHAPKPDHSKVQKASIKAVQNPLPSAKKPVIIFSNYDDLKNPDYGGGGARAVHEIAKRLSGKFEILVLTGKYPCARKIEIIEGVKYERIGSSIFGSKLGQIIFHFALVRSILKRRFDLWMECFTPPISTSFLPLLTKKPVIGLVHMLSGEDMYRKYKIPFYFVENIGIKKYDNFIVTTEESANKIRKINKEAFLEVIPNGVSLSNTGERFSKKHILFMGRIEIDQKGLDLLLAGYAMMSEKESCPLMIAGSGSEQEIKKLEDLIQKLNISRFVKLLGKVDGAEKEKIYKGASAVVVSSRFETFSLTALESLAYQVPLICFDIEGLRWIPEKLSFKIKPFDVLDLSHALSQISTKTDLISPDPQFLGKFLKDYDWANIADRYESYFNFILKNQNEKS